MEYITKEFLENFVLEQNKALVQQIVVMFEGVNGRLDAVGSRLDKIEIRLDAVDARFDSVDLKIDSINRWLNEVDRHFGVIDRHFIGIDVRLEEMEEKILINVNAAMQSMHDELGAFREEYAEDAGNFQEKMDHLNDFVSDLYDSHERRLKVLEAA